MDIMLERVLEVIPKKHGAIKELAEVLGISGNNISDWKSGRNKSYRQYLPQIADYYDVSIDWLCGRSDQKEKATATMSDDLFLIDGISPLPKFVRKPRLGTIACGKPILAVEDAEEFDFAPDGVCCDFTLKCRGDSMINARIFDGDTVYIRRQPEVENGEIAAVLIGDEATLKKVYRTPGSDRITLRACNPLYADFEYEGETLNDIKILGKAIAFTSAIL